MKILFLHQNFPGQYKRLARVLAEDSANQVVFLTQRQADQLPGVRKLTYEPNRAPSQQTHHYIRELEKAVLNGQAVVRRCQELQKQGFNPDVIVGHNGWGETLFVKDVWPDAPLLAYFEYFYRLKGGDVGFDPQEHPQSFNDGPRSRCHNSVNLLGLSVADAAQTPTEWQKSRYPKRYHDLFTVVHDGIDTERVVPDPAARLISTKSNFTFTAHDEVITYVARNLEPYRGFHIFMRALPAILSRRPKARAVIVGGDEISYGRKLPEGHTYRQRMLNELGDSLDLKRVHFLGRVPYPQFLMVLQVSRVHVYLTYPFVLSWSMLEAMSAQCLVVASNTPPVTEVIEDCRNGLLVDFFDVNGLVDRVVEALSGREAFQKLRENARRTVFESYDLKARCLPRQLDLLQSMLARPAA